MYLLLFSFADKLILMDKTTKKTLGEAIGLPDDVDKENIRKIILKYDKKHPGYIQHAISEAKADFAGTDKAKFGEVNKSAHGRVLFELPEELHANLETYIPTLFREKTHLRWFIKHFKELLIPEKY